MMTYKNIKFIKKNNEDIFDLEINEGVPFLVFKDLKKYVNLGFSTKFGGVSEGNFDSMNLGLKRGDDIERVKKNFEIFLSSLKMKKENLYISNQTHSTNIKIVRQKDKKNFLYMPENPIDGLITSEKDIILATFYADCVPLIFVDKNKTCIGLSHAGWRGTVGKIASKTIEKMIKFFKVNPKNLLVGIGPSICMKCYEIGADLVEKINKNFPKSQYKNILFFFDNKWHLDLWELNKLILLESGILEENIITTNICTFENSEYLFSHRKSPTKHGNMGAFLSLK